MRQFFFDGRSYDRDGYERRAKPSMGGFVWNNGVREVMWTYTPEQLPVLNGLAKAFAVSDEWFCSTPDETAPNRAFALTGSTLGQLSNFQNNPEYEKLAGHTTSRVDLESAVGQWLQRLEDLPLRDVAAFTAILRLHLPIVSQGSDSDGRRQLIAVSHQAIEIHRTHRPVQNDAKNGNLPNFSFLEPVWIASEEKSPTSYHPGASPVPAETALNEIYEALKAGPAWNETLLDHHLR